jgi:cell division protein ZapA (FtsZ GTPase activity inhibitor)
MPEPERLVRFNLLGQELAFYTGASEEEVRQILTLVQQQIEENSAQSGSAIPAGKVAVMTCLNLASKYIQLEHDYSAYKNNMEAKLELLNERLGSMLSAGK